MMRDSVAIKASLLTLAPALAVTAVVALVLAVWLSMAGLATTEKRQREFRDAWWPGDLDAPDPDPDDEAPSAR